MSNNGTIQYTGKCERNVAHDSKTADDHQPFYRDSLICHGTYKQYSHLQEKLIIFQVIPSTKLSSRDTEEFTAAYHTEPASTDWANNMAVLRSFVTIPAASP